MAGGVDDVVVEFVRSAAGFVQARRIPLGHKAGLGLLVQPAADAVAVSPDGRRLLVANYENDSVSLIDVAQGKVLAEQDLRPGKIDVHNAGQAGGTYPRAIVWTSNEKAYVAAQRDREVIALGVGTATIRLGTRLKLRGQPVALAINRTATRLYVALDNSDALATIVTADNRLIETVPTVAPRAILADAGRLGGAGSNALALSADGATMLVSNGGQNAIAVVALSPAARGVAPARARKDDRDDVPRGVRRWSGSSRPAGILPPSQSRSMGASLQ